MSTGGRFRGRQTQFYIELLYGGLFILGFGILVFRTDPRIAAFEGGLVVGYLLRIWEKMSIYERILQEAVSREAAQQVENEVESQVESEVEAQVENEVEEHVEAVQDEMEAEVQAQVESEVESQVESEVEDRLPEDTTD